MRKYKIPAALLLNGKPVPAKTRRRVPHRFDTKKAYQMPTDNVLQAFLRGEGGGMSLPNPYEPETLEYSAFVSGQTKWDNDL